MSIPAKGQTLSSRTGKTSGLPFCINLMLLLAISFITFQQIAYLVECYRMDTKELNRGITLTAVDARGTIGIYGRLP